MLYVYTFYILAFMGLGISWYLVYKHYISKKKPMVCIIGHDCSKVTESKWNTIFFGIRNDMLGLLFYVGLIAMNLGLYFFPQYIEVVYGLNVLGEVGAATFSVFLIGIQAFVLKEYCFWCLSLSAVNFLLLANTIVLALPYYG